MVESETPPAQKPGVFLCLSLVVHAATRACLPTWIIHAQVAGLPGRRLRFTLTPALFPSRERELQRWHFAIAE